MLVSFRHFVNQFVYLHNVNIGSGALHFAKDSASFWVFYPARNT